jgi:hypothetical protein
MASASEARMAGKLNATWHRANRMPAKPSLDQRIVWHLAHARACACRSLPAGILVELKRRRIRVPGKATRALRR